MELMAISSLLQWLNDSALAILISENDFLFPWIESIHVLAITTFFGSIAMVDLRLIHIGFLERSVHRLSLEILPYTWTAFCIAFVTGGLLFISKAISYAHNEFFLIKMCLLIGAAINMLIFQKITGSQMSSWVPHAQPPRAAKIAGIISLLLWITIIICGRWIGFTLLPTLGS
jgi:hypothetical protein